MLSLPLPDRRASGGRSYRRTSSSVGHRPRCKGLLAAALLLANVFLLRLRPRSDSALRFGRELRPKAAAPPPPPPGVGYSAIPFHLSCPHDGDLPPGEYRLALVYHVAMVNNWADVVRDQMRTLSECGLGRRASSLAVSFAGGGDGGDDEDWAALESELRSVLEEHPLGAAAALRRVGRTDGASTHGRLAAAAAGIRSALQLCRDAAVDDATTVVFHFHNGGASDYRPDWWRHRHRDDEGNYSRSLYWRKYAEHFTLERPGLCAGAIVSGGASTCGATVRESSGNDTKRSRYAEDFWAASCEYLRTVWPSLDVRSSEDASDLLGIGLSDGAGRRDATKAHHVELHRTAKDRSKRLIHPEEYDVNATRFHLACPRFEMPREGADGGASYRVVIAYHVGCLGNWREVVRDQLETLRTCGLGRASSSFLLSHSNATKSDLEELLDL